MQARALVCGPEGAGQGHLAPALLAALEALPVHAIGLPNLLSDANSRCALPRANHPLCDAPRCTLCVLHEHIWTFEIGSEQSRTTSANRELTAKTPIQLATNYHTKHQILNNYIARSPEEALVHAVVEARRAAPAILYLPHLQLW